MRIYAVAVFEAENGLSEKCYATRVIEVVKEIIRYFYKLGFCIVVIIGRRKPAVREVAAAVCRAVLRKCNAGGIAYIFKCAVISIVQNRIEVAYNVCAHRVSAVAVKLKELNVIYIKCLSAA